MYWQRPKTCWSGKDQADTRESVSAILGKRIPVSVSLMVYAQLLALALAVPIAVLTTQGKRMTARSSASDVTTSVTGCGSPSSVSNRLKPALLCAAR